MQAAPYTGGLENRTQLHRPLLAPDRNSALLGPDGPFRVDSTPSLPFPQDPCRTCRYWTPT